MAQKGLEKNCMLGMDLNGLLESLQLKVKKIKGKRSTKVVAIFDLVGSTPMKLMEGHSLGTRAVLLHNLICRRIVTNYAGIVVKELGDGILVAFDDPISACLAAVDIKTATQKTKGISTKAGLTMGAVEEIEIAGIIDLLGTTVDRCARIQAVAVGGQILLDSALHDATSSFLKDYPNVCFSPPTTVSLRGIGKTALYELSTKESGFVSYQRIPFVVHEKGRLLISEKVAFMQNARYEIIELGTGLTTFTGYFTNRRPAEFKDHIIKLLQQSVTFKCMLLDPDCNIAKEFAKDLKERTLIKDIRCSIRELKKQQNEFESLNLKGSFEIYVYRHAPYFHAVCIDPETEAGRITISHYIHGLHRAEAPVFQFCKALNKEMFAKYWLSTKELLNESKRV